MNESLVALAEQYAAALEEYIGGAGEQALQRAYELGREAIVSGLGVLDIAAVYQEALLRVLLRAINQEESSRMTRAAADFFIESLSPFEMAQRGYQDANTTLLWMNETLQERQRLLAAERTARSDAENARQRLAFLAEASAILSSSLDHHATLLSLTKLAVPFVADWCVADVIEDDQNLHRVAVVHMDAAKAGLAAELEQRSDLNDLLSIPKVMRARRSELVPQTLELPATSSATPEQIGFLGQLGWKAYMTVPLLAHQRTLGTVVFVSGQSGRDYGPADLSLAEDLALRAALAVDNARLYTQAQRAVQARDQLLSIVSHDLRNLLGVILMSAMILARNTASDERRTQDHNQLEAIRRSAERMNRLIQDLLDVARIETGHMAIERRSQPVASMIRDAVEMLRPLAEKRCIQFASEVQESLPPVFADRERIFQVFSNLVGNAIKFTPEGGSVTVGAESADSSVCFWVRDNGPGIEPEHLAHVFDRFWQAKQTARLGTGLGLSIAKGIVETHGGTIWVKSTVGEGSVFYFTLPTTQAMQAAGVI